MNNEEIKKILEDHLHWLKQDCDGWENMRANLEGANLQYADLQKVDLRGANLHGADLREVNAYHADFKLADLSESYLSLSNFFLTDFSGASLCKADLYGTNLRRADFEGADLSGVDIREADLFCADLRKAKNIPYITMVCPEEGSFIGWKKGRHNLIVKLEIPEDALRSSGATRKCRCNKAKVLALYNLDGSAATTSSVPSIYAKNFTYRVGDTVTVDNFDMNRWNECSTGIHFFLNRQEAIDYLE